MTAREIVAQHEQTNPLRAKVEDASAKVGLIQTEIAFNLAVAETLEEVQRLSQQLEAGRAAIAISQIPTAIEKLESVKAAISEESSFSNTNVMSILSEKVTKLRKEIEEALRVRWNEHLGIDGEKGEFRVDNVGLDETVLSLSQMGILESASDKFQRELAVTIIDPLLLPRPDGYSRAVAVTEVGIRVEPVVSKATVTETLNRTTDVLNYLRQNIPRSLLDTLSQSLIPEIASKTIKGLLSSTIPTTLNGLEDFETTLEDVLHFTKAIESWDWAGQEELVSWVNQAPRLWLTRRRVDSLDSVRKALAASEGTTKQVERVEKERVSREDEAFLENAAEATADDWDANWDDDKEEAPATQAEDEEDVSAWGLDEEDEPEPKPDPLNPTKDENDDEDDGDAWGWGDDEDVEKGDENTKHRTSATAKSAKEEATSQPLSSREMTLKELYTITDIPDSILNVVQQQIFDSEDISKPP